MKLRTQLLLLMTSAVLNTQLVQSSYALSEHTKTLQRAELKDYYQGSLHYKPFVQGDGIYGFSVFRANKLILHKKAPGHFISALYIEVPYRDQRAKPVHTFDGGIDDFIPKKYWSISKPIVDLNGDGVPDIIAASLDSRLTTAYEIYSLSSPVKIISKTEYNYGGLTFIDLDNDGKYEAVGYDGIFHYWCTSGVTSPAPVVVLEFGKNGLQLSTSFMQAAAPSRQRQDQMLAEWSAACQLSSGTDKTKFWLDSTVWRDMLDLIYSGNSKLAFILLDRFWTPGTIATNLNQEEHASKTAFIRAFLERLSQSRYFEGIKRLNPEDPHIVGAKKSKLNPAPHKTIFLNRVCDEATKK